MGGDDTKLETLQQRRGRESRERANREREGEEEGWLL
jgi:hypothetical protein